MQKDTQRLECRPEQGMFPEIEARDTLDRMVRTFGPDETMRMAEAASRSTPRNRNPGDQEARKFLETRIVRSNNTEFNCRQDLGKEKPNGYT